MTEIDRTFTHGETVKLRAKPEVSGPIQAIHLVNNVPAVATIAGWGDRFFEEIAHEWEDLGEVVVSPRRVSGYIDPVTGNFIEDPA